VEDPVVTHGATAAIASIASVIITVVIQQVIGYRKADSESRREDKRTDAEITRENKKQESEIRASESQLEMNMQTSLLRQYQEAIVNYESRFTAFTKQVEEREMQWQGLMDKLRMDHNDCLRNNARMEGRMNAMECDLAAKDARINALEGEVEDLKSRLTAKEAKRAGHRRSSDTPPSEE
jgi:wobble nucleotide-excising tRNase